MMRWHVQDALWFCALSLVLNICLALSIWADGGVWIFVILDRYASALHIVNMNLVCCFYDLKDSYILFLLGLQKLAIN